MTRAVAFAADAAIVNGAALLVGLVVGLALSILSIPSEVDTILLAAGGAAFAVWTIGYFATFWSATGQTPGDRLMGIRVRQSDHDAPLDLPWALVRFGALVLAALPLLLGFVPILLNDRRRGVHDLLAGSIVVYTPPGHVSARRRAIGA